MKTEKLLKEDSKEIINLWNNNISESFIYKKLDEQSYLKNFFREDENFKIVSFKAVINSKIVGFSSGVLYPSRNTFYITMILVEKNYRYQGVGEKLYAELEKEWLKDESILKVDLIFSNPVNLIWTVPRTNNHEHPNAPGVDFKSDAYLFFKNLGFRDFVYQNSYYRKISDYEYSENILNKIAKAKEENLTTDFYKYGEHIGLEELMTNLNSESWEKEILSHVREKKEKNTLLVALDGNKVIGFTGPIHRQDNGRGYFAGIGIHSDYRGRGVGTLLFSKLCMEFKNIGVEYMTLFTGKSNPARNIYERENFKIVRSWANMRKEVRR